MEGGLFRLLLVAGLLAAVLPAAAATFGPQPGAPCNPTLLATQVALFCAPDMPTAQCCEPVVAAVDLGGGVPCLCRVAAEPQLVMAGVNATHLLTLYTSCGGLRPGGAHLAATCEGPAPSAAVVSAPPPSPGGPRRKQPAHEAPPPPPSMEKPSPPPQQHDGAAHSKAVPAYAATSPLAPAPAPAPAYEGCVGPPPPSSSFLFEIFQQQDGGGQVPIGQVAEFSRRILVEQSCDPYGLAGQLAKFCGDTDSPSSSCCQVVIRVINEDCLCQVVEMPEFIVAGMDTRQMWSLYVSCHGTRPIPIDKSICRFHSPPPPPPPSPSAPSPPHSPPNSPNPEKPLTESNIENMVERLLSLATEAAVGAYVVAAVLLLACAGLLFAVWKLGRGRRVTGDEESERESGRQPERDPGRQVELVPRERAPHRKSAEGRHHETQRQTPQTHTVVAPSAPPIPEGMFE